MLPIAPNNKVLVTRCAKALQVRWVPESHGLSAKSVAVTCARTVGGPAGHWKVFVPVGQASR